MLLLNARWFWAERFRGEWNGYPFRKSCRPQAIFRSIHPDPALISPPPSNLAPGGFVFQNLTEASDSFPNEMLVSCCTGDVPPESWLTFAVHEPLWFCFSPERWSSRWVGLFLESIPYLVYPSIYIFMYLFIYLSSFPIKHRTVCLILSVHVWNNPNLLPSKASLSFFFFFSPGWWGSCFEI